MQSIQKILNISSWNPIERIESDISIHSSEKLESITKIALGAIALAITSMSIYFYIKKIIISKFIPLNPTSSMEKKIIDSFRSIGIDVEKDPNDSGVFLCVNSSFVHINRALQHIPEKDREHLGEFYYSPEKRSICCDFNKSYSIQYPKESNWISLIKASQDQKTKQLKTLSLPNGSQYSEDDFIHHPLFSNTLEKHNVFRELCKLQSYPHFQTDYQAFLEVIRSSNMRWAEGYRSHPVELAYLSLTAYLDSQITKEELFVIQMLASAFLESPDSAQFFVLSSENIHAHLKEYFYITTENETKDFHCLRNLDNKSLILRTAISYESKQNGDRAAYTTIVNRGGENPPGVKLLKYSEQKAPVSLFLLPPWLWKRLYAELFSLGSPPIEHEEFFGFRKKINDLIFGRPISYASPLFYLPTVHRRAGAQLAVTAHDILFHCLLDWKHPYAHDLIKLGQKVWEMGQGSRLLARNILDRPMTESSSNPDKNIAEHIRLYSLLVKDLPEENQAKFFVFCQEIFGEKAIDEIFSTNTFDLKFRPQSNESFSI